MILALHVLVFLLLLAAGTACAWCAGQLAHDLEPIDPDSQTKKRLVIRAGIIIATLYFFAAIAFGSTIPAP